METHIHHTYLELALAGEDADPLVVVVCDDDVTCRVHCHTCGALELPWRPSPHPKTTLEFPFVGENLEWRYTCDNPHRQTQSLAPE